MRIEIVNPDLYEVVFDDTPEDADLRERLRKECAALDLDMENPGQLSVFIRIVVKEKMERDK